MMIISNKRMRPTGFEDITSDGISSLPNEILHHILSLMPAREAVQTCVLSTRWRYVWKSLRCLKIEGPEFSSMERFVEFMDNLLLERDSVPLDSFCLVSWSNGAHCLNHPRANQWISHALTNKVCVLRVVEYYELFNLDPYPFISVHLKVLSLNCVFISALFIENLLSNCPALEDLTMIGSRVLATKFSSRTLKNLTFISLGPNDDYDVHDDFEDLVIDTPNLVSLHLEDLALLAPCLVNVSSVVKASFRLDEECFSSSDANCNILSALSNVMKLKLVSRPDNGTSQETETVSKVLRRDLWRCQAFSNLKSLSVGDWCVDADLSALLYFLRRSPVLKKLVSVRLELLVGATKGTT
ncbi:F-box protein At4g22280 isoform X1 [Brachypodium distachyon]|uniref:F-box protein At4g22280 isoform X1 n=1 Tax=Brachypodium distachyon TaxID=15368 RepID=UPI00053005A1|nr:F-box protein At4g22280 isoform X1 [Brachypodium distachyon]|eukprot:XP_010234434.1 F-box protein At4g22280 isoform X1 [Brachypodium distachyon]